MEERGKKIVKCFILIAIIFVGLIGIASLFPEEDKREVWGTNEYRLESIPEDSIKYNASNDPNPPVLHNDSWYEPIPMEGPITTAGLEDSPFITPDGQTFYFWFSPIAGAAYEQQLTDHVTGIWTSDMTEDGWSPPRRVWLAQDGHSLDGCPTPLGDDLLYFCSVRGGNYRDVDNYVAHLVDGEWTNIENLGELLNLGYDVGELHFSADGLSLYFGSPRPGGKGGYDLWVTHNVDGDWQEPINLESVNTEENEAQPFLTPCETELWFTRRYEGSPGIFRSFWNGTDWDTPELIVSSFSGEPTLDAEGNLYFVHLYYEEAILGADIYVAYKK